MVLRPLILRKGVAMKLLYGNSTHIKPDYLVYNFSGLLERYPNLNLLPQDLLGAFDEVDFDMKYLQFIFADDTRFMSFMDMTYSLTQAPIVYILIGEDEWSLMLIESMLKILSARYGITGTYVKDEEDALYAEETDFNPYYGIQNYDTDVLRYIALLEQKRIEMGGKPYVND